MTNKGNKRFFYKVFTISGQSSSLVSTWYKDIIGLPNFEVNINGGMGEMRIMLARKWTQLGEQSDLKNGNKVKLYVADIDTGDDDAKLIASGFISGYTPQLTDSSDEKVEVVVLGNSVRLQEAILTASGNTLLTFYSVDPSSILAQGIGFYNTTVSGGNTFSTNIDYTGSSVSYNFNLATYKDMIDKVLELAPQKWWYSIDPDDSIQFHPKRFSADHTLVIGQHIVAIAPFKNIEDVVNVVYFVGDGISKVYRNSSSILLYGEKSKVLQDGRVSVVASADILATSYLNEHAYPEVRARLTIIDNNGDATRRGYDIDSIKVGHAVSIIHPYAQFERTKWNEAKWNETKWNAPIESVLSSPMQVVRISYAGDQITLELSTRYPEVSKRLEDINRNLAQFVTSNLVG